jgi:hypothetical protein
MGPLILAAITGGLILLLFLTLLNYRGRAINAENKRDEAITISARALEAKSTAEEGFQKMKTLFDEKMKMPVVAFMTDEQINTIANYLAEKLFMSNTRLTSKTQ